MTSSAPLPVVPIRELFDFCCGPRDRIAHLQMLGAAASLVGGKEALVEAITAQLATERAKVAALALLISTSVIRTPLDIELAAALHAWASRVQQDDALERTTRVDS